MAVFLIDTLKQKNNGQFALIDSNDILGGVYSVETLQERDDIPLVRRKVGMLCYVNNFDGEGNYFLYQLRGGIANSCWHSFEVETDLNMEMLELILLEYAKVDHDHGNIYAYTNDVWLRSQSYNKWEVYNMQETYNKNEVYNKEESYSKEEIDKILSMLETGGSNFILHSSFLRDEIVYPSNGTVIIEPGKITVEGGSYIDFKLGSIFSILGSLEPVAFSTELGVLGVPSDQVNATVSIFDADTSEVVFSCPLEYVEEKLNFYFATGTLSKSSANSYLRIDFGEDCNFFVSKPTLSTGNSPVTWSPSPQDSEAYADEKIKELLDSADFREHIQQELELFRQELDNKADVEHTHTQYYNKKDTYSKQQVDDLLSNYTPGIPGEGGGSFGGSNYFFLREVNKLISML